MSFRIDRETGFNEDYFAADTIIRLFAAETSSAAVLVPMYVPPTVDETIKMIKDAIGYAEQEFNVTIIGMECWAQKREGSYLIWSFDRDQKDGTYQVTICRDGMDA
jgi:hypothetical protein